MDRSKITIKEIAKITGYSVSTVSKAINDSFEISQTTRERIVKVCQDYGYIPNRTALSLRSGKNYVIAVVMPSLEDPFYARVFHGIQHEIINTNYSIISCITKDSLENEIHVVKKVFNQVDAFIVATAQETIDQKRFDHLQLVLESKKPFVLVDRNIPSFHCDKIISNHKGMVKDLTKEVFSKGYRNLLVVSSLHNDINNLKLKGFLEALEEIHLNNISKTVLQKDKIQLDSHLIKTIESQPIDAILSLDEEASFAAIRVSKKLNKNVPGDIGIVGYMSERVANNLEVPLTTINQHRKTMGKEAIKLVLNKLETAFEKPPVPKKIKIKSTIVHRTSL